jgi:hypothetical protein
MSVVMDEIFVFGIEIRRDGILLIGAEKRAYVQSTLKGSYCLFYGVPLDNNVRVEKE